MRHLLIRCDKCWQKISINKKKGKRKLHFWEFRDFSYRIFVLKASLLSIPCRIRSRRPKVFQTTPSDPLYFRSADSARERLPLRHLPRERPATGAGRSARSSREAGPILVPESSHEAETGADPVRPLLLGTVLRQYSVLLTAAFRVKTPSCWLLYEVIR